MRQLCHARASDGLCHDDANGQARMKNSWVSLTWLRHRARNLTPKLGPRTCKHTQPNRELLATCMVQAQGSTTTAFLLRCWPDAGDHAPHRRFHGAPRGAPKTQGAGGQRERPAMAPGSLQASPDASRPRHPEALVPDAQLRAHVQVHSKEVAPQFELPERQRICGHLPWELFSGGDLEQRHIATPEYLCEVPRVLDLAQICGVRSEGIPLQSFSNVSVGKTETPFFVHRLRGGTKEIQHR